jgi:hypothetical protein
MEATEALHKARTTDHQEDLEKYGKARRIYKMLIKE